MNNEDLIKRIEKLEAWQAERERQQLSFPLDFQSVDILKKFFMHITGSISTIGGAGGNTFTTYVGQQNDLEFLVEQNTNVTYTVATVTNILTASNGNYEDDMSVYVATSNTTPAPLVANTEYFVINSSGRSFKLSATSGGAEIDITTTGTGIQYLYFFQ